MSATTGVRARAAVVPAPGRPAELRDVEIPDPRGGEVLVRLTASGVCHTDLSVQAGRIPFRFPGVLGHEGAGVVEATGDGVTSVRPGDRVLLISPSCGRCRSCAAGHPALCAAGELRWGGTRADGSPALTADGEPVTGRLLGQSSFATRTLVEERTVLPVSHDVLPSTLAPFGCGVVTGAGAVLNVLRPAAGSTVVVLGAGAVGLSAVMAAALTGAARIIAVDRLPARLALAAELGATDTIDGTGVDDVAAAIRDISPAGADAVVETTARTELVEAAVSALARGGTVGLVGAPPQTDTVRLAVVDLVRGAAGLRGVVMGDGTPDFLLGLIALHERGRFPVERLVRTYPFEELERAMADSASGAVVKPVITFPS